MKTITDCTRFGKISKAILFILFFGAGIFASSAFAATVTTDHLDYSPGDIVTITGTGFQPGESVSVRVTHNPLTLDDSSSVHQPWIVVADGSGNFVTTWTVPTDADELGATLLASAYGLSSNAYASASFTDASTFDTIDFHQAANQSHPSVPIDWINGILNSNNSDYFEGIGVPQRIIFTGVVATSGNTHSLTFRHQAIKGGVHAYDFLISYAQAVATAAAIGQGSTNELLNLIAQECNTAISSAAAGACVITSGPNHMSVVVPDVMGEPTTVSCGFPPAVTVNSVITCFEGVYGNRTIDIYGDAPITAASLSFDGYDNGSGDSYAKYTLNWTSTSSSIVILMAGRSAQSCTTGNCCGYGSGCGAGSVSGGPYHFKLDDLDGHTTGSQDNQLQAVPNPTAPTCDSVTISGPATICPNSTGNSYTSTITGPCANVTHHWSISGNGSISGSNIGATINITAGTCGQFTICDTITCDEGQIVCCRTISVVDAVAPVVSCPAVTSPINCPSVPSFGNATASDNCDNNLTMASSDVTTPGCGNTYSVTRTWTATDDCGNSSTCSRTIVVQDITPPTITCPTVTTPINCPNAPNFGNATATDACDASVAIASSDITTPGCGTTYSVVRTWTATDDCGNTSTCSRTIVVQDITSPTITCPAVTSPINCPSTPNFGNATATDACDASVAIASSDVTTPGCGATYSVVRTWTATDDCGNTSTCSRTIVVQDITSPTITCPAVTSPINCPSAPNFGNATATDACDASVAIASSDVTTPGCGNTYTATRTWTATDDCGNTSTCSRTIVVQDITSPTITCPSISSPINCPNSPSFSNATATDACDASVTINSSDITTPACGNTYSVTRTWTATDDCGNSSTCSRTIAVQDVTPPSISCPSDATILCGDPIVFGTPTVSDACDASPSLIETGTDTTANPDGSTTFCRTWEASDDCGNVSSCSQCLTAICVGNMYCGFTQGFWGNAGGRDCHQNTTTEILTNLLSTQLVVGCNANTFTIGAGDVQCVLDRLPGGGPSAQIFGTNTCSSIVGIALHSGNPARFRNTLLAQTITLMLNVRYDVNLGGLQLGGIYMSTIASTGCDTSAMPTGTLSVYNIPQTVITYLGSNNTVNDLIALANAALCGSYVPSAGQPTLGDINKALDALNQGFDECRFLINFSNTLRDGGTVSQGAKGFGMIAYPNPFNSMTSIEFTTEKASDNLKLEIFTSTGQLVATLFNGPVKESSVYKVDFDGTKLSGGVYTYRVSTETDSYFDKLILIK